MGHVNQTARERNRESLPIVKGISLKGVGYSSILKLERKISNGLQARKPFK